MHTSAHNKNPPLGSLFVLSLAQEVGGSQSLFYAFTLLGKVLIHPSRRKGPKDMPAAKQRSCLGVSCSYSDPAIC